MRMRVNTDIQLYLNVSTILTYVYTVYTYECLLALTDLCVIRTNTKRTFRCARQNSIIIKKLKSINNDNIQRTHNPHTVSWLPITTTVTTTTVFAAPEVSKQKPAKYLRHKEVYLTHCSDVLHGTLQPF